MEPIPFDRQLEIFHDRKNDALRELVNMVVDISLDRRELFDLCVERMHQGYRLYNSAMFYYSEEERYQNVMEELADVIVYLAARRPTDE